MRRILRRPAVLVPLTGLLAAGMLLMPGAMSPAEAGVVPSPGLPSTGVADPHGVSLSLRKVAGGLSEPVFVASAIDGGSRLYVVERAGVIKIYTSSGVRSTPYLDIRGPVYSSSGEQGLLGLAFSPHFLTDHRLWVAYVDSTGGLQVSRFTATSASAATVSASTEVKLLRVPHPSYTNHNGGMLAFGRENYLYISTGDGGGTGDPFSNAQDRTSGNGKILRIDPFHGCNGRHYCIPSGNPYSAPGGAIESIWLYGLRNPWRFSVDSLTGDLWVADVGQDAYEEVTRVPFGERAWNMGWSCREGRTVYNSSRCSTTATYHDPTIAYPHSRGEAVIGGYVYRGSTYANLLGGLYVFGDFISGNLWVNGHGTSVLVGNVGANRLTAFGQGDQRGLWATTIDGGLYQVVASAA